MRAACSKTPMGIAPTCSHFTITTGRHYHLKPSKQQKIIAFTIIGLVCACQRILSGVRAAQYFKETPPKVPKLAHSRRRWGRTTQNQDRGIDQGRLQCANRSFACLTHSWCAVYINTVLETLPSHPIPIRPFPELWPLGAHRRLTHTFTHADPHINAPQGSTRCADPSGAGIVGGCGCVSVMSDAVLRHHQCSGLKWAQTSEPRRLTLEQ